MNITATTPFLAYISQMALPEARFISTMGGNPFIPGGDPSELLRLGRSEGEWTYSHEGPPYTFIYHSLKAPLQSLGRFKEGLQATLQTMPDGSERRRADDEVKTLGNLLSSAEEAYHALPSSYPEEVPPDGIEKKNEKARWSFKALRDFLEIRVGLAMIATHASDPAAVYFGIDRNRILVAMGLRTFP